MAGSQLVGALAMVTTLVVSCSSTQREALEPLATASAPATRDAQACATCHPRLVAMWSASAHRSSWSDPVFQAGYSIDNHAYCRDCHAPAAAPDADPPATSLAARQGVDCAACHGARPHVQPAATCASCHQFDFPDASQIDRVVFDPDTPMQMTHDEWQQSGTSLGCVDCHMPWQRDEAGRRWRGHRFVGVDARMLARAVDVEAQAWADGSRTVVRMRLRAKNVGHAVPTGDLFRALELRVGDQTVMMRREFGQVIDIDGHSPRLVRTQVRDTRLWPARPRVYELELPGTLEPIPWMLSHLRMPDDAALRQGIPRSSNRMAFSRGFVTPTTRRGGDKP